MKKGASVLALLLASSFLTISNSAHAITYNATVDTNNLYPNVIAITGFRAATPDDPAPYNSLGLISSGQCTATVVKRTNDLTYILTASHCANYYKELASPEIGFSVTNQLPDWRNKNSWKRIASKNIGIVVHPKYRLSGPKDPFLGADAFRYDISMLVVKNTDLPEYGNLNSMPELAPVGYLAGLKGALQGKANTVVGFGSTELLNFGSNKGGPIPSPFSDDIFRRIGESYVVGITSLMLHSSQNPAKEQQGTCFGDSGGPQFVDNKIVSVTSTGDAMCRASDMSSRIDLTEIRSFIDCVLNATSINSARQCGV